MPGSSSPAVRRFSGENKLEKSVPPLACLQMCKTQAQVGKKTQLVFFLLPSVCAQRAGSAGVAEVRSRSQVGFAGVEDGASPAPLAPAHMGTC